MVRLVKDITFYLVNGLVPWIPSRSVRMLLYFLLSNGRIRLGSRIALNVRILDIRNIYIEKGVNVNYGCVLDGRGAKIIISRNSDIAPYVRLWTLEHDPFDNEYSSRGADIIIGRNAWIGSSTTLLPGTSIGDFAVIGAGSTFKGVAENHGIYFGQKAIKRGERGAIDDYTIPSIRRFR